MGELLDLLVITLPDSKIARSLIEGVYKNGLCCQLRIEKIYFQEINRIGEKCK